MMMVVMIKVLTKPWLTFNVYDTTWSPSQRQGCRLPRSRGWAFLTEPSIPLKDLQGCAKSKWGKTENVTSSTASWQVLLVQGERLLGADLTSIEPPLLAPWVVQSSHCCLDEELLWRENVWSCCRDHQLTAFPATSTLPWPPLPFHIGGGPPIGNINHCCACCLLWEQLKISKLVQLKALTCSGLADSAVVEIRLKPGQSSHDLHRPKCTYVHCTYMHKNTNDDMSL